MTRIQGPGDHIAPELYEMGVVDDDKKKLYAKTADVYYFGKVFEKLMQIIDDPNTPSKP